MASCYRSATLCKKVKEKKDLVVPKDCQEQSLDTCLENGDLA